MKIAVFEIEPWEREAFQKLSTDHDAEFISEPLTQANVETYSDADIISPFIYSKLDSGVMNNFAHLKLIATRSTGFDHIDLDYCQNNDVVVCNVPTYGENTVAEHVFGLLLTISHNLVTAIDRTRRGDFSLQGLRGFDLRGKKLGVIGIGHIGRCVIKIAGGFSMDVMAYDVRPNKELASQLCFRYLDFDEILSTSDIITLHVPYNNKTHHLLSQDQFNMMKEGVIIINTSRGSVIDIQALLQALAQGKVVAVGLDVLPEEPAIREEAELLRSIYHKKYNLETILADHILLRLRNVYITPHSAFYTREAIQRILDTTVDNIAAFAQGRTQNVVSKK